MNIFFGKQEGFSEMPFWQFSLADSFKFVVNYSNLINRKLICDMKFYRHYYYDHVRIFL